jgi:predicted small lipoprotein YifL
MLQTKRILVSALVLAASVAGLSACGQPGPLYLPTEPAAARRATLPQSLLPGTRADDTAPAPAAPASSPPISK